MKKNEINILREYLLSQITYYHNQERELLDHIRFLHCDSLDLYELARAKDNTTLFMQVARDIMILLHLAEDQEDFKLQYSDFVQAVIAEESRRRKNRGVH
ncbi:MAG: hypothetical protein J6T10_11245 [Methanobrevibacter sp.]|nr:hypothetical protein [Methanobrevibacter sp.]